MVIAAAVADGPNWTDVMTAIGTVGAVFAAVGIALWSDRHSRTQLADERRIVLEREQLAQAYAVRVQLASKRAPGQSPGNTTAKQLAAFIDNKGDYSITRLEVQFCLGLEGVLKEPQTSERVSAFMDAPRLRQGFDPTSENSAEDVLTPWDVGVRFESPVIPVTALTGPYVVARWTDQWGTRWEHKRGVVRRIREDEPWEP